MIPDIWIPAIINNSEVKQAVRHMANIKKVSMMGVTVINLKCLKTKEVIIPQTRPTSIETTPSSKNWPIMTKTVLVSNVYDQRLFTVLNNIIETISLNTPSPKMHEKSFGCASQFTIDTAATTSEEQSRAVNSIIGKRSNSIGIGPPSPPFFYS